MPNLVISDAKPWHCGQIARRMRKSHADALVPTGTNAHAELRGIFNASAFCRVAHIGGRLMALGGVAGTLSSSLGYVWLALAEDARGHALALVRAARSQLREIMQTHSELATTILRDDRQALNFAVYLGFHTDHPSFSAGRRTVIQDILGNRDLLVPIGGTFVIPMGFHARGE